MIYINTGNFFLCVSLVTVFKVIYILTIYEGNAVYMVLLGFTALDLTSL
jgi:hypothetical protein